MIRSCKRALSLFLAVLLCFYALSVRTEAALSDVGIPEIGPASDSLRLPKSVQEAEPEPVNYRDTLYQDFVFKEDGDVGTAQQFYVNTGGPALMDYYMERHYTEVSKPLQKTYRTELKELQSQINTAQQDLKAAEKARKSFNNNYNAEMSTIKNKYHTTKQTQIRESKLAELKGKKADLGKQVDAKRADLNNLKQQKQAARKTTADKMPRSGKLYKIYKGVMIVYSVVVGALGIKDMWDNPEVGYKSAYLETLATGMRAASNVFGMLSWYPPFAGPALGFAIGEMILTSETVKAFLNRHVPRIWGYDELAKAKNWVDQKIFFSYLNWYYGSDKQVEEINIRKNAHIANKLTTDSVSGMLPPGVFRIVQGATACARQINAYKPNIYLYPEALTEMSLRFAHPSAVSVSDPLYPRGGWRCTALPDGTLYSDGTAHSFLFYEAVTSDRYYQREAGFLIPAEDREDTFGSILADYGLNPQEIEDFNAYWCAKLEPGCDYAMYPQLTETVDAAMPMQVSPQPDSILRIWFAFVKNGRPAVAAVPQSFARDGSTLVEWGGFFLDEPESDDLTEPSGADLFP